MKKRIMSVTALTLLCGTVLNTTSVFASTNNSSDNALTNSVKKNEITSLINKISVNSFDDSVNLFLKTTPNTQSYLLDSQGNSISTTEGDSNQLSVKLSDLNASDTYTLEEYDGNTYSINKYDITKEIVNLVKSNDSISKVNSKSTTVSGVSEATNSHISITSENHSLASGETDSKGHFSLNIPRQLLGTLLTVNTATFEGIPLTISTEVEATNPDAPTINLIKSKDTAITGQTEPLAIVFIKDVAAPNNVLGVSQADINGNFVVNMINPDVLSSVHSVVAEVTYDNAVNKTIVPVIG